MHLRVPIQPTLAEYASLLELSVSINVHNAAIKTPSKPVRQFYQHSGYYTIIRETYLPQTVYLEGKQVDTILYFLPKDQGAAICSGGSPLSGDGATTISLEQPISTYQRSFSVITDHLTFNCKGW